MRYYVIEIQTNADGTAGNFVWGFATKEEAEAKYYAVLNAACTSSIMVHTAVMLTREGVTLEHKAFIHPQPAPEPEAEPDVVGE